MNQNPADRSGSTSLGLWFDESEPRDEHDSFSGVLCFDEKSVTSGMEMKGVLCNIDPSMAPERKDDFNQAVFNPKQSHFEGGKFQAQNDLSSTCEDYLLDIEFSESITHLDYGSSKGLLDPILESQIPLSSCDEAETCGMPYSSGLVVQEAQCQNTMFGLTNSELHDISCGNCERQLLVEYNALKFPSAFTPGDISNVDDVAGFFAEAVSSEKMNDDMIDSSALSSKAIVFISNPKQVEGQDVDNDTLDPQDSLATNHEASAQARNTLLSQKRLRKPTRRYIDESSDRSARRSKKREEVSTSASKDKFLRLKYYKKSRVESTEMELFSEESPLKAIQVPFASLGSEECHESYTSSAIQVLKFDKEALVRKPEDDAIVTRRVRKPEGDAIVTRSVRKPEDDAIVTRRVRKPEDGAIVTRSVRKPEDGAIVTRSVRKPEDDAIVTKRVRKPEDDAIVTKRVRKSEDDAIATKKLDEDVIRRKHHRLWTVAEVRKLVDGVSQYGVGRWSHIKKLFFSSSAHRTAVDLKDKWRNLLKASHLQKQSKITEKGRHNLSWRPLPKSVLHRVSELANMHPYPRNRKCKALPSPCSSSSPMYSQE